MSAIPAEAVAVGGGLIAAIGGMAAWRRRHRRIARIDGEQAAMARAGAALPGFAPLAAVVGQDGAAALVSGRGADAGERLALLHARSGRLATRAVDWSAVRATPGGIVVETGERRVGGVPLAGIDALDVRRLAPAASAEAIRLAERLAP